MTYHTIGVLLTILGLVIILADFVLSQRTKESIQQYVIKVYRQLHNIRLWGLTSFLNTNKIQILFYVACGLLLSLQLYWGIKDPSQLVTPINDHIYKTKLAWYTGIGAIIYWAITYIIIHRHVIPCIVAEKTIGAYFKSLSKYLLLFLGGPIAMIVILAIRWPPFPIWVIVGLALAPFVAEFGILLTMLELSIIWILVVTLLMILAIFVRFVINRSLQQRRAILGVLGTVFVAVGQLLSIIGG